jgi:protein-L-isoaspartate(D-aspartate) O-methyltransferase
MMDFQAARRAMVDGQVRTSDVTHLGIISAMLDIPREAFVPKAQADSAPYDVILIDGGVETVPDQLCTQLSSRGRLLAIEVTGPAGKAKLFQPVNGRFSGRELFDASAPVLPGFGVAPAFVF